jgi:hypothetical protein
MLYYVLQYWTTILLYYLRLLYTLQVHKHSTVLLYTNFNAHKQEAFVVFQRRQQRHNESLQSIHRLTHTQSNAIHSITFTKKHDATTHATIQQQQQSNELPQPFLFVLHGRSRHCYVGYCCRSSWVSSSSRRQWDIDVVFGQPKGGTHLH